MNVKEIAKGTFQVDFPNRFELLSTFLRFQEFYESPEFKDKIFTLDEYTLWYMTSNNKKTFTYYDDWSGCNVPSYVFNFFRNGHMNPLSEKEKSLLNLLPTSGEFYVIGTFDGGDSDVIEHEKLHSLFYSNKNYKENILKLLNDNEHELSEIKQFVSNLGYHDSVLLDEVQAYIGASSLWLIEKKVKFPLSLTEQINKIAKQHGVINAHVK